MGGIRQAAVAGTFYPRDPAELEAAVANHVARATPPARSIRPKAMILPHAGYVFSGPVAGTGYVLLGEVAGSITRVVLVGPAHRVAIAGLAASGANAFATPLGKVPVNAQAIAAIRDLPQVCVLDEAHAFEHCLEVHLPFLQHVLGDFSIVPLLAGDASPESVAEVLDVLWGGDETLIVVSSDLSHYHDHATARRLDAATTDAIERLDPERLGPESACGRVPIAGLLVAARRRGLDVVTLDLRNSGDTAGGRAEVVGYGAYAFVAATPVRSRSGT